MGVTSTRMSRYECGGCGQWIPNTAIYKQYHDEHCPGPQPPCPDGGTCHHACTRRDGGCWRVAYAGPLTGVYPDDVWPDDVRRGRLA